MLLLQSLLIITCIVVVPTLSMSSEGLTQRAHGVAASQKNLVDGALHSGEFHVVDIEAPVGSTAAVAPAISNEREPQNLAHSSNQIRSSNQISPQNMANPLPGTVMSSPLVAEQASRAQIQKGLERDLHATSIELSRLAFVIAFFASYHGRPDADTWVLRHTTQLGIQVIWGFVAFMSVYLGSCILFGSVLRKAFGSRQDKI